MDFVAIMLFTQQVFHIQYLFFFQIILIHALLLFGRKSQPDVSYKVLLIKECSVLSVVLYSCRHEEITVPHEFIFVFNPCNTGEILAKNVKREELGKYWDVPCSGECL